MIKHQGALRALIVDGEPDVADSLAVVLEMNGLEVSKAYDGESALLMMQGAAPGVLILELLLPDTDGYQLAQVIRGDPRFRETCLIAHTADGTGAARDRCAAAGFDVYALKPIDPAALLDAIALRAKETAGSDRSSFPPGRGLLTATRS